jgi:hypothetical protein
MKSDNLLFEIFEQQLVLPGETENEAPEPFAKRVVWHYLETLFEKGYSIPHGLRKEVEDELYDEVLEMTRKKTYGYQSVDEYRKKKINPLQE